MRKGKVKDIGKTSIVKRGREGSTREAENDIKRENGRHKRKKRRGKKKKKRDMQKR